MDESPSGLLRLPLELRHQIYGMCFDTTPEPGLLGVNRLLHDESVEFIRKKQHSFSFIISGKHVGFDDFSLWCFRIKHHTPRLNRMRSISLNIYPPDPDRPVDMWHIWKHVQNFCKEIASRRRIKRLTVKFLETDHAKWKTTLEYPEDSLGPDTDDIGQIITTLIHFIKNVDQPGFVFPQTYDVILNRSQIEAAEKLLTGHWIDENSTVFFEILEDLWYFDLRAIQRSTGRKSKSIFEQRFGRVADIHRDQLMQFDREWPHMFDLNPMERPRCRWLSEAWSDGKYYVEVSMPHDGHSYVEAEIWHQECSETTHGTLSPFPACGTDSGGIMYSYEDWNSPGEFHILI